MAMRSIVRPSISLGQLAGHERARERLRGIACMAAGVFIFAIRDALVKGISSRYGPLQVACLRSISSWLFLLPPIAWAGSWRALRPRNPPLHLLRAVLGIGILASVVYAVHRLSLAQTYSVFLTAPLLMTALSVPILGEKVAGKRWLAIVVGLCGVLVILKPWGHSDFSMIAAAAAATRACPWCFGIYCWSASAPACWRVRTGGRCLPPIGVGSSGLALPERWVRCG